MLWFASPVDSGVQLYPNVLSMTNSQQALVVQVICLINRYSIRVYESVDVYIICQCVLH